MKNTVFNTITFAILFEFDKSGGIRDPPTKYNAATIEYQTQYYAPSQIEKGRTFIEKSISAGVRLV